MSQFKRICHLSDPGVHQTQISHTSTSAGCALVARLLAAARVFEIAVKAGYVSRCWLETEMTLQLTPVPLAIDIRLFMEERKCQSGR